ncbi:hypothetical protein [Micromonospora auratinigra]|uniref:DUF1963 domain-containing protein n=1 Tax=Micromonospora auratinigra TaxID=261654 RepID=A0A1A8Z0J9_9ACTN|nr:hypothetical protein [Micromonospora auratinigra]SBT37416.1 hypothetical protein GA0070611_0199 [Micromonospora auratinigra]
MIDELVRAAAREEPGALEELERVAAAGPDRLAPHLDQLIELEVLWPPTLYRAAGADVVRRLVERVESGRYAEQLDRLLLILAHTRDPLAEAALRRWDGTPPPGASRLHIGALAYALQGGWALGRDGGSRELCGPVAYRLEFSAAVADPAGCPWCGSPLWPVVDLDTADPRVAAALAHTGWRGRLRLTTCHLCSCYTTLFTEVTPDGGATWSTRNVPPGHLPRWTEDPPAVSAVPGPPRATPYQADAWSRGGSTLGGHPQWIQDAEHPSCPTCDEPMDHVGMVGGADLDDLGEGAYYLHLHASCGVAAVNYQQS